MAGPADRRTIRLLAGLSLLAFGVGALMLRDDNPLLAGQPPGDRALYGSVLALLCLAPALIFAAVAARRTLLPSERLDWPTRLLGLAPLALAVVLLVSALLS